MKLTIKNLHNIHGKSINNYWEINNTIETNDDYYFELTNRGHLKHTIYSAYIERMKYGDGYRLHSTNYKGNVIERYIKDVSEAGVLKVLNEMFENFK